MRARLLALLLAWMPALGALAFDAEFVPGTVLTWPGGSTTYRVNATSFTAAGLSDAVITASFDAWANDPLANLTLTRGTNISGAAEPDSGSDGINEVEFITSGWADGAGVLGVTYVYFSGSTIVESDMYLNGQQFLWDDPTGGGCTNRYDLGSTVTHEAGHFIGLGHSSELDATCNTGSPQYDAVLCDATMYYAGGPCDTTGQSLECDDLAGLRFLYPPGGTRRADWVAQGFSSVPAPGAIAAGTALTLSGTALNSGSLTTSSGVAAVYVTTAPGSIAGGTRLTPTAALGQRDPCRSQAVSLPASFSDSHGGTRWLVVRLDDTTTTSEYDETTNNLASIGPFTVSVAGPVLAVSSAALEFDAAQGGAAPASQAITVSNTGAGTFTWTASDDRPWISLSQASGSPGQGFNVSLDITGLAAGRHEGTITVSAAGAGSSPQIIAVGLDITAGAILSATPETLTFSASPSGALPASQQVAISNTGSGSMSWSVSDDQSWMSVAPASGVNAGNVSVSITSTALAVGTYQGSVTITAAGAQNSPRTVAVTYQVTSTPAPVLDVAPASLAFSGAVGSSPASQQLNVSNTGGGTLNFTAASNRSWLAVLPGAGTAPAPLTVSVNTAGLSGGIHSGSITVTSSGATGSPRVIPVTLTLSNTPSLLASPASLSFATEAGSNPASKTFSIANDGSGSLTYTISEDGAWLSLSPSTGATLTAGASRLHQAQVNAGGLAPGFHQATITVTAAAANDSPQVISVSLEVGERPPLVVAPLLLSFAATPSTPSPAAQPVAITTSGATSAAWSASANVPWLNLTPSLGIGDGSVSVRASSSGLAAGTHAGQVTLSSGALAASPQVVDVSFTVAEGPRVAATPSSILWSATRGAAVPAAQQVSISNAGTGTFNWSISGSPSWLHVAPASGSGDAVVTLTPTTTSLPPGRLVATLQVSAPGAYDSPRPVELTYDIVGPALAFAPERVRFELSGGSFVGASQAQVLVSDLAGAGAGNWTAVSTVPWLAVSPASGSVGSSATLSLVQPERLRPGLFDASIIFSSPGAANSPAPVPVTVVVRQAPGLAIHPSRLDLVALAGGGVQPGGSLTFDESGDRDGDFTITASPPWLVPQALLGRSGARVAFDVHAAGLAAGVHQGSVVVNSGGETLTVPVELDLRSTPRFVAGKDLVTLSVLAGGISAIERVSLDNVGAAPDSFQATASAQWIVVDPASGSAPDQLEIRANAGALSPGTHRGTLSVGGASGASALFKVVANVAPAGAPAVAITQDLDSGCAPLTVTFTDSSTGAVSRTWRFADGTTASTPSLMRTFDAPGEHLVTLTVTNASGSATTDASVIVRQPPLAFAGGDRRIAFEPDGETRVALENARAIAAAPARLASIAWSTTRGVFADTGTTMSSLERPVLVLASGRGGLDATLSLSLQDDAGCVASDSAVIFVRADVDFDGDTYHELIDNCPGVPNSLQADLDGDGLGTPCDPCPDAFDPSRVDADGSGIGDACESAALRSVGLSTSIGRACDGLALLEVSASVPGRTRRLVLDLGGRQPTSAGASGAAAAAGGVGHLSALAGRVELRVPAGVGELGSALSVGIPTSAGDDIVEAPCLSLVLGWAASEAPGTCAGGEVRLRPDGDIAPASLPDGTLDIADVVRLLRAAVGLEDLAGQELARADLAPGVSVAGLWQATPDCSVDISDVVVALRVAVGLVTLR